MIIFSLYQENLVIRKMELDEEVAQMVDKAILGFLDAENVKYSVITGSTKERSEQIMKIVGINKAIVQPVKAKEVEGK